HSASNRNARHSRTLVDPVIAVQGLFFVIPKIVDLSTLIALQAWLRELPDFFRSHRSGILLRLHHRASRLLVLAVIRIEEVEHSPDHVINQHASHDHRDDEGKNRPRAQVLALEAFAILMIFMPEISHGPLLHIVGILGHACRTPAAAAAISNCEKRAPARTRQWRSAPPNPASGNRNTYESSAR